MRRLSRTNENLGAIDIEKIDCHMGCSSLSILRSDFQDILISTLESLSAVIQYAHTVMRIETKNPGVAEVYFTEIRFEKTTNITIGVRGLRHLCSIGMRNCVAHERRKMNTATLSSKFQLSLPKALRESMHLQPGQQFELIPMGSIIQMVPKTSIKELRGIARGANSSKYRDRTDRT